MRWAGDVAGMGDRRGAYRVFVGRLGGKRQLKKRRPTFDDNIKSIFKKCCGEA
jgi:hypothetical protein